jgi:hypothetical protein
VPERHGHLLDEHSGEVLCTCRACSLLFNREAAGGDHFRLVPDRRIRLVDASVTGLGVPVGMAFFVPQTDGRVEAFYPSPAGATHWDVDDEAWRQTVEGCPQLATMQPMVEAFLVKTARGADERWLVPIDECFRLVAVVRTHWKGLSGGSTVWPAIREFFVFLGSRSEAPPSSPRKAVQ